MTSFKLKRFASLGLMAVASLLLIGCGGGGGTERSGTGTLSIGLTDAAAETAVSIMLRVTGVTVKRSGGPPESFPVDPPMGMDVDLLALSDGQIAELMVNQEMIAGQYQWIRLEINEDESFVVPESGGMVDLRIPSPRGLQLSSGFVITVDRLTHLVIDWDARQGLTDPVGQDGIYFLRPSLRVIDMSLHGSIAGTVADSLTMAADCDNDLAEDTGNAVYVFENVVDGVIETPDDIDNNDPNPLVTTSVNLQSNGSYAYEVRFVPPGSYTVAFTCQGLADDVPIDETDLTDGDDPIVFINPQLATVVDGQEEQINF